MCLQLLPLPLPRALGRRLSSVQVPQPSRLALVALGEGVLLAGLGIAVVGDDPGVIALDLIDQVGDQVLRQLGFQLEAGGVVAVRGEAVLHVPPVPDDGVDFGLHALQGVGEFGHELRAAQGELVGEGGGTVLQAVPLGPGGAQRGELISVGVAQVFHILAAARDGLLLLGAADVVVEGAHRVVALAIGLQVAALVSIPADQAGAFCSFQNPDRAR